MIKKIVLFFGIVSICLSLSSCISITRQIQNIGNRSIGNNTYPAALVNCPDLQKPAYVDLSAYKSVHARRHERSDMAIALAASGGGYRAANLTLGVLMGLEKMRSRNINENLLKEIDYFSTVSGSGFGVGFYITQLHNHILQYGDSDTSPKFSLNETVHKLFSCERNILTDDKTDDRMLNPLRMDLTEFLFFGENRGYELEKRLSDTILRTPNGTLTLGDIFIPKNSSTNVTLPYWATNSTIYQNVALFPITPDLLARYKVTGFFHNKREYYFRNIPYATFAFPVSVGVTASATVPFATPPTTLISNACRENCYLQLYDGGLADNLGVYTALSFLLQDKSKIKILIIVDASRSSMMPFSKLKTPPDNVSLLCRVVTAGTDANRENLKPNINLVAREILAGGGATNVIVIYLDLNDYPSAQEIGTQLSIAPQDQAMLLHIGQELVLKNSIIRELMKEISEGNIQLGHCCRTQG